MTEQLFSIAIAVAEITIRNWSTGSNSGSHIALEHSGAAIHHYRGDRHRMPYASVYRDVTTSRETPSIYITCDLLLHANCAALSVHFQRCKQLIYKV